MLVTFIVVDGGFLYFCVNETLEKGPSQLIMFGFEVRIAQHSTRCTPHSAVHLPRPRNVPDAQSAF